MNGKCLKRCLWVLALGGVLLTGLQQTLQAGYDKDLSEDIKLNLGADMRIRLERWDRTTVSPEMTVYGRPQEFGPAYEYLRVRTRVWGSLTFSEDAVLFARLGNRWQYFSSRPGDNNNGFATWEFPDEAYIDQLYLKLKDVADSDWSMTIGRQDFMLGNGMVILEGTPYDQGRSIYFDGVSAQYKTEEDTLSLFAFYNTYKDKGVFINDQNRRLRRGDIFTTGAYWTHDYAKNLNTDLYYIYTHVHDTRPTAVGFDGIERNFPSAPVPGFDQDALIHTMGIRFFGPVTDALDYSFEYARQYGEADRTADLTGSMMDGRLTYKFPEDTTFKPTLMLQYVRFSGDDPSSADEVEGWDPIFASYPIWGDDMLPIMLNANWTNMSAYRTELGLTLNECVTARAYCALLRAEYGEQANAGGGGTGNTIGYICGAFVNYKVNKNLKLTAEAAYFEPNSYWTSGDNATWLRLEAVLTF